MWRSHRAVVVVGLAGLLGVVGVPEAMAKNDFREAGRSSMRSGGVQGGGKRGQVSPPARPGNPGERRGGARQSTGKGALPKDAPGAEVTPPGTVSPVPDSDRLADPTDTE